MMEQVVRLLLIALLMSIKLIRSPKIFHAPIPAAIQLYAAQFHPLVLVLTPWHQAGTLLFLTAVVIQVEQLIQIREE
jgi:hypothetical protein